MDLDLVTNNLVINDNVNLFNNGIISWIVFGYTHNKTLNVVDTGDDNYEDMFEEFDSNKVMYGFLAIIDQNTQLKKNVFIIWQGEAASQTMKTASVQHANIISKLCKPVHVTHSARYESDLDLEEIKKKVALSSGANYSCQTETKTFYEHKSSIKSEGNTAANERERRLRELSALGSIQREPPIEERIGSRPQKINAMDEIKNLRNSVTEPSSLTKATFENKVVVVSENNTAEKAKEERQKELATLFSMKSVCEDTLDSKVGTNYTKINPQEEINKLRRESMSNENDVSSTQSRNRYKTIDPVEDIEKLRKESIKAESTISSPMGYIYKRTNTQEEFNSLQRKPKSTVENKVIVMSENNTAERAKEERQKELSMLFGGKSISKHAIDFKVGTNYTKINPLEEIQRLRRESTSVENDEVFSGVPGNNYKKIIPMEEIMKLRSESLTSANDEVLSSPSSVYKKINPINEIQKLRGSASSDTSSDSFSLGSNYRKVIPEQEIRQLRSANSFSDEGQTTFKFEKVNAMDEINQARRLSMEAKADSPEVHYNTNTSASGVVKPFESLSARKSFERIHKTNDDSQQTQRNRLSKQSAIPEREESTYNTLKNIQNTNDQIKYEKNKTQETKNNNYKSQTVSRQTYNVEEIEGQNNTKKIIGRAEFKYETEETDEVGFEENEIIKDIEKIDEIWWVGTNASGKRGMFPASYVEEVTTEAVIKHDDFSVVDPILSHSTVNVRALFDFISDDDEEISFRKDEIIYNVDIQDSNWWTGEVSGGKRGMFPASYVERV